MARTGAAPYWILFRLTTICGVALTTSSAASQTMLYPDMFPYVDVNAPSTMKTLQAWELSGSTIRFPTMFANQGAGLFEIRRGPTVNATRYELLQRVYQNNDFGSQFVDISIGTAPIPGTAETPRPTDLNAIWFEDFARFSLFEAPLVDGVLTIGPEVASTVKTSWRVSANRGPLPGFEGAPVYASSDQAIQQRVSVGWGDLYAAGSPDQFIDIAGIPVGPRYWLRQAVDPEDRIHESDETNNSFEILIDLARPGEAVTFAGQFVRPGDAAPPAPGDLNADGLVDRADWLAFKAGADVSLDGLSNVDAYLLGDLNLDGVHNLSDVTLFRQQYEAANGTGSFAALQHVPEPTGLSLAVIAGAATVLAARRVRRYGVRALLIGLVGAGMIGAGTPRTCRADVTLFSEDFEGVTLRPNLNETVANPNAWTDAPPSGWVVNDAGVPTVGIPSRGVKEWEGWSFADKNWWISAAGDQNRSQFQLGTGVVAVADPDEWDDRGAPVNGATGLPPLGYYTAWMRTPAISLDSALPGFPRLSFASSWRPECCDDGASRTNNQTAVVRASYDGAPFAEILRWDSNSSSPTYKGDATNEQVILNLNHPAGSHAVVFEFGLLNAGNDWWWAIDNVAVVIPTTLMVDTATGRLTIAGATDLAGYEIKSASGGLDPARWATGNLDARNFGSPTPATSDFTNNGAVDGGDFLRWQRHVGTAGAPHSDGDANDDGAVNDADLDRWSAEFAATVKPGESWERVIASDSQLIEYFLTGSSQGASLAAGQGFDVARNARDLKFFYADSAGRISEGPVVYTSAGSATATLSTPEPTAAMLASSGALLAVVSKARRRQGRPQLRRQGAPVDQIDLDLSRHLPGVRACTRRIACGA